jgi:hypothetical protein
MFYYVRIIYCRQMMRKLDDNLRHESCVGNRSKGHDGKAIMEGTTSHAFLWRAGGGHGFLIFNGDHKVSVDAFNQRCGRLDIIVKADKVLGIEEIRNKNLSGIFTLNIALRVLFGCKRNVGTVRSVVRSERGVKSTAPLGISVNMRKIPSSDRQGFEIEPSVLNSPVLRA